MMGVIRTARRSDRKDNEIRNNGEDITLFPSPAMTVPVLRLGCQHP
jgi:hypothetical protein